MPIVKDGLFAQCHVVDNNNVTCVNPPEPSTIFLKAEAMMAADAVVQASRNKNVQNLTDTWTLRRMFAATSMLFWQLIELSRDLKNLSIPEKRSGRRKDPLGTERLQKEEAVKEKPAQLVDYNSDSLEFDPMRLRTLRQSGHVARFGHKVPSDSCLLPLRV